MSRSDYLDNDTAHAQIRECAERITRLLSTCDALERDGLILIAETEWIAVYALLIKLHEIVSDEINRPALPGVLLRLGMKLAVLEALVEAYVRSATPQRLH